MVNSVGNIAVAVQRDVADGARQSHAGVPWHTTIVTSIRDVDVEEPREGHVVGAVVHLLHGGQHAQPLLVMVTQGRAVGLTRTSHMKAVKLEHTCNPNQNIRRHLVRVANTTNNGFGFRCVMF